jgi:malate/lactate dehydrogenase
VHLGECLGVSPSCIDGSVIGEHGTSRILMVLGARRRNARARSAAAARHPIGSIP